MINYGSISSSPLWHPITTNKNAIKIEKSVLMIKYFRILRQSYKIFSSLSSKLTKFKIVLTFNCGLCIVFNKKSV